MTASPPTAEMIASNSWLHRWVFYLAGGFMFAAAGLRAILVYQESALFGQILLLLAIWAILFTCDVIFLGRLPLLHVVLIGLEVLVTLSLLALTRTDFFGFLFAIPCMQCSQHFDLKPAAILIGLAGATIFALLFQSYGAFQAFVLALVYSGGTIFLVAYVHSTRRLNRAEAQQRALANNLQQANQQLAFASGQVQRLAAARERQRLGRELHDSVTQTIFSMTLTTQAARLLLSRDLHQVSVQLERLDQLARSALGEMQVLIDRLAPERQAGGRLIPALQAHIENRLKLDNLAVTIEVESDGQLESAEEEGLFRIAQEALNNVIKHARTGEANLRIHLDPPAWIEISDRGVGFDVQPTRSASQFGLAGMKERAVEIGWSLQVLSAPGAGTRIRLEKNAEMVGIHGITS